MRHPRAVLRWTGTACLASAGLMAVVLAWPSSRDRIGVALSSEQMQSAWVSLKPGTDALDLAPVPSLALTIDFPQSVFKDREERVELVVDAPSGVTTQTAYTLAAEVVSVDVQVTPPDETGQALSRGASFEWTIVAKQAPQASATILVRLRRHSLAGGAEAERLVLARDIAFPVRSLAGLSAPTAKWAVAILGFGGALLWIASIVSRTR